MTVFLSVLLLGVLVVTLFVIYTLWTMGKSFAEALELSVRATLLDWDNLYGSNPDGSKSSEKSKTEL